MGRREEGRGFTILLGYLVGEVSIRGFLGGFGGIHIPSKGFSRQSNWKSPVDPMMAIGRD